VEERNTFYVAPFFLIALLLWVQLGARRPRATTVAVALGAGLLVAALPFPRLLGPQTTSDTLALVPWWSWNLQEHAVGIHHVWFVATLWALGAAALFVLVPRRWALALPLLVLVYFAYVAQPVQSRAALASRNARAAGIGAVPDDWLDRAVGHHATIGVVWAGRTDPHVLWENEFFNRSVGPVYYVTQPPPGGFASAPFSSAVPEQLLLSDGTLDFRGAKRASDSETGVNLWQVAAPPQPVTAVAGLYPDSNWSGQVVVYQRQACTGGSLHVELLNDPHLFPRPQTVTANGFARVIFPGARAGISVPLQRCAVRFVVSPTRPVGPGQQPLGIRFLTFAYSRS